MWSWELARQANRPALEAALLAEPGVADALGASAGGGDGTPGRLLALAEAREDSGDGQGAAESYRQLLREAGETSTVARLEAVLGLYRTAAAAAQDEPTRVAAFAELAERLGDLPGAQALHRQAGLLALVSGQLAPLAPRSGAPGEAATAVQEWLSGARDRDPVRQARGLDLVASLAGAPAATSALYATAAVRWLLAGQSPADSSLARGSEGPLAPLVEVAVTDLGAPSGGSLAGLRRARAERLAGPAGAPALGLALLLEDAGSRRVGRTGPGRRRDLRSGAGPGAAVASRPPRGCVAPSTGPGAGGRRPRRWSGWVS